MQQDNNHIENELRQLENQQLPDLSNMDKHWQNMQQMLSAGVNQKNTGSKSFVIFTIKRFFLAASVLAVVFAIWFYNTTHTDLKKNNAASIVKAPGNQKASEKNLNDATQKIEAGSIAQDNESSTEKINQQPKNNKKSLASGQEIAVKDIAATEPVKEDIAKESLESFYNKLQKPTEEFEINADDGGMVTGKEGTIAIIPPSAFTDENGKIVSGPVNIMIEEFYKYSDMVAANLTTTSDGKQLATGGMIKITATSSGSNLNLRSNKEISLKMPTRSYDPAMKLFTSENEPADKTGIASYASYNVPKRNINWNLSGQQNSFPVFDGKTNFPNFLDQPYNVIKTGKRRIAKFALSKKSSLTPNEMEKILKEKYGDYYDVIKVTREDAPKKASNFFYRGTFEKENVIGDSSRLTLEQALKSSRYIEKKDSAFYAEKIKSDSIHFIKQFIASKFLSHNSSEKIDLNNISLDSLDKIYNDYLREQKSYSFSVKKLGWINCDKYCNHNNNKTNFVINLPSDVKADKFVSQVVFMSIRSVMPGRPNNNQIGFQNIPADMGVYVVGLGERNGKVVSFMEKLKVGKTEVNINDLQETTPEAFRKKIAELDMN